MLKQEQFVEIANRERKYRNLFENALVGMIRLSVPSGDVLEANGALLRMLRCDNGEQLSTNFRTMMGQGFLKLWDLLQSRGSLEGYEFSAQRRDGQPIWLSFSGMVFRPDGMAEGTVVDITERRLAEQQIRDQAELLDKTSDVIIVLGLDAHIQYWNRSAERLYGWSTAEVLHRHIVDFLFPGALANGLQKAIVDVRRNGEWNGELELSSRSRGALVAESRLTLVRDFEGKPKSILCINTDITQKKQLESQVMRAQRMESIGTLAGGIAHDLNNILAPIVVSIDILKRTVSDTLGRKTLTAIESSARRGADMVKQVLTFARGIQGERIPIRVEHVLAEVIRLVEETLPRSIEVQNEIPKQLWPVMGDATQLHQVFMNLVVNARDAMPQGGRLTLRAQNTVLSEEAARLQLGATPGPYIHFEVIDTGSGIPENIREKIFEPFFTTKDIGKGTGLGLSTTLGIVKSHGGFLKLDTEVGRGTDFHIYLPAELEEEARRPETSTGPLRRANGELVLIIDDEASLREVASSTLHSYGYRTALAEDGIQGLDVFRSQQKDVRIVVTDMMMPRMGGAETIRELRKIDPNVKILVMTGMRIPDDVQVEDIQSVDGILQKPYTADQLVRMIQEALDGGAGEP